MPSGRSPIPAGLRWRLTAWVAAVMLISAVAIFVVVYQDTGSELRGQIDHEIANDSSEFSHALQPLGGVSAAPIAEAAGRYVRAQPYSATSTLLFLLVAGQPTVSNHPEVFSSATPDEGEALAEQARENKIGRTLLIPRIGCSTVQVSDVGGVRIHRRPAWTASATRSIRSTVIRASAVSAATVALSAPIAIPTSASARAGASLTPSPTITAGRSCWSSRMWRTTSSFSWGESSA